MSSLSNVWHCYYLLLIWSLKILTLLFQVVDKCLMDGADEYLQLMALFTTMMREICRWPALEGCWPLFGDGDADQWLRVGMLTNEWGKGCWPVPGGDWRLISEWGWGDPTGHTCSCSLLQYCRWLYSFPRHCLTYMSQEISTINWCYVLMVSKCNFPNCVCSRFWDSNSWTKQIINYVYFNV